MARVEFYRHALTEDDIAAVTDTLRSVFLTTGPRAALFEQEFAKFLGVEHAISVSSCTSALYLLPHGARASGPATRSSRRR